MSESKFTPGPWKADGFHVAAMDVGKLPNGVPYDHCIVERTDGPTEAEAMLNARLIAAAPDLLAACQCERDDGMDGNILREAAETLRCRGLGRQADRLERKADAEDAAIALATKEQPCGSSPN